MVNTIKNDINSLEKLGTNLISKYKLDVAELYKKKLQSLEMPILMQSRDFPVEAEYSPPPSSGGNIQHFFGSAFAHNFETVFEEQLAQGLISFFTNLFSRVGFYIFIFILMNFIIIIYYYLFLYYYIII